MALYGAAKAPAVMNAAGETVQPLTDDTTGTPSVTDTLEDVTATPTQALINNNFATLAAKIEELMAHMNDGRTS